MKNFKALAILVLSGTVLSSPVFSQKNVTQANLFPGPLLGLYSFGQERAITDRMSIQTSFRFMPARSIGKFSQVEYEGEEYNPFSTSKLSALGNFTELRIYGKNKEALRGFYWGPYVHYTVYKVTSDPVYATFKDNNDVVYYADVENVYKLPNMGAGLQIGVQKVFDSGFVIDWTILGIGFNQVGLSGSVLASNTSNNFDFRNYSADVDKATFGIEKYEKFLPVTKKVEPTSVELSVAQLLPHLKMGVAIGFGY
jgi:hypothetical protein